MPAAPHPTGPAVHIRDLHHSVHHRGTEIEILRGLDLTVQTGERLAVLGPSGSGKSTLLDIIRGITRPQEGVVEVGGLDVRTASEGALAALRRDVVASVAQDYALLPALTAQANVALALRIKGVPGREATERAAETLGAVGMGHRLSHRPETLSGGELQRVAVARALVTDPAILLADEPTAALDPDTRDEVLDLLAASGAGRTMIVVTHDASVVRITDRALRLHEGRLTATTAGQAPAR